MPHIKFNNTATSYTYKNVFLYLDKKFFIVAVGNMLLCVYVLHLRNNEFLGNGQTKNVFNILKL